MSKINLLTLHYSDNNGGALQTYATCVILRRLGHDVTLINLKDRSEFTKYFQSKYHIKKIPRYIRFHRFQNKYYGKKTPVMFSVDPRKIPPCDYTVIGSDQVWNLDITYRLQKYAYFLDFVNDGSKKIALASSFGKMKWDAIAHTDKVKEFLSYFAAISVREASGVDICRDVFGVDAVAVIDPTLALDDFSGIIDLTPKPSHEIRFFLFKQTYSIEVIDYLIEKTGLKGCNIGYPNDALKKFPKVNYFSQTPKEWLEGIRDAEIFLSDSFHGVACSIILRKQFIALCADEKKFERIRSLLTLLHLENRIVLSLNELKERYEQLMTPIDYSAVEPIIKQKQKEYLQFISTNIR